ncbi:UNVERIFIED_CONTAM: hypothetical protein Sradi_0579200 [Sesamum radiatum]|uniref:Uncharacterized protein n=1 Tax=Sesamum radiatum TaxID=300843 RepID=A0AAW2VK18_SESRA
MGDPSSSGIWIGRWMCRFTGSTGILRRWHATRPTESGSPPVTCQVRCGSGEPTTTSC